MNVAPILTNSDNFGSISLIAFGQMARTALMVDGTFIPYSVHVRSKNSKNALKQIFVNFHLTQKKFAYLYMLWSRSSITSAAIRSHDAGAKNFWFRQSHTPSFGWTGIGRCPPNWILGAGNKRASVCFISGLIRTPNFCNHGSLLKPLWLTKSRILSRRFGALIAAA